MALNPLSLSSLSGVLGQPFFAKIIGLTTGKVEVLNEAALGFWTVNGNVMSNALPYPVSTVVLREYEPGVGVGYRDSRIEIFAASRENVAPSTYNVTISSAQTGEVLSIPTWLSSPLTVSRESGSNAINFTAQGNQIVASLASGLTAGTSASAIAKAVQANGAGVLIPVTINAEAGAHVPNPSFILSAPIEWLDEATGNRYYNYTLTLRRDGSTASHNFSWTVSGTGTTPASTNDFNSPLSGSGTFAPDETTKNIEVVALPGTDELAEEFSVRVIGLNTTSWVSTIPASIVVTPTLTLTGPLAYDTTTQPGAIVATIGNVPAGDTPSITPNDGRLVIAGNASDGWRVVVGSTVSSAGTINLVVTSSNSNQAAATVTVANAGAYAPITPSAVSFPASATNGQTLAYITTKAPRYTGGQASQNTTLSIVGGNGGVTIAGNDIDGWRLVRGTGTVSPSYTVRETGTNGTSDTVISFTSSAVEYPLSSLVPWGVNFGAGAGGSSVVPGTININYSYGTTAQVDMAYFYGAREFRIPVLEERLLSAATGGTVSANFATYLKPIIDYILTLPGTKIIIDKHSYGTFFGAKFQSDQVANAVAFWDDVFGEYKGNPRFIPSMQNEPKDAFTAAEFTGTTSEITQQRASAWWAVVRAWINAMGADGWTQKVIVPGMFYQGASSWFTEFNAAGASLLTTAQKAKAIVEVHQYMDAGGGTTTNVGSDALNRFDGVFVHARENGYKVQIGETAFPNNAAGDALYAPFYQKFQDNADVLNGITLWAYNTFQPLTGYIFGLLNDKPLAPSPLLIKHCEARKAQSLLVSGATPDAPMEPEMVPPNTEVRSTYDFTKVDGIAIDLFDQFYNTDGTVDGQGVYYPGGGMLKMPCARYPDRMFAYSSKHHGVTLGADGGSGIFMTVVVGDPRVPANWKPYEEAVAAGWLYDIPSLPAKNPIYEGAPGTTQRETPWVKYVTDDDGVSNGMYVMSYQTGGGADFNGTPYAQQSTLRCYSTDGVNWSGPFEAWAAHGPEYNGPRHTGYVRWEKNYYLTDVPWKYIAYGLGGFYGCNDPRDQNEMLTLIAMQGTGAGRTVAGITSGHQLLKGRWDPSSMKKTRNGVSMLVQLGVSAAGGAFGDSDMYEIEFAPDGLEVISKPIKVIPSGPTGSIDAVEIQTGSSFIFGDSVVCLYQGAGNIPSTGVGTKARGLLATSPIRNPLNTVFPPLSPPTPLESRKQNIRFTGSALPAGLAIHTTGSPTVTWSDTDDEVRVVFTTAGQTFVLYETEGFDPNTTEIMDVTAWDWACVGPTDSPPALRVPYVGMTAEPGPLASMQNMRALTFNPADSYKDSVLMRDAGVDTRAPYSLNSSVNPRYGYGANSGPAKIRFDVGFRWFPQTGHAYFLNCGTEEASFNLGSATIHKGKRWHRFVAFEATGACTVRLGGIRMRDNDSNRILPTPQVGKTLTLGNLEAVVGSAWTSAINNHTVGSALTATSSDGTTLTVGAANAAGVRNVSGTFSASGSKTITLRETPIGGAQKTTTVTINAIGAIIPADIIGTPTILKAVGNNATYNFSTPVDIGAASATRKVVVFFMSTAATTSVPIPSPTATITPDGGSPITMTLVDRMRSTELGSGSTESHVSCFIATVPTGTTATVSCSNGGVTGARASISVFAVTGMSATMTDSTKAIAARQGGASDNPLVGQIDYASGGITLGHAYFSTSSSTHVAAGYTEQATGATNVTIEHHNNQSVSTWTGLTGFAPTDASTIVEAGGVSSGGMLVVSFPRA